MGGAVRARAWSCLRVGGRAWWWVWVDGTHGDEEYSCRVGVVLTSVASSSSPSSKPGISVLP